MKEIKAYLERLKIDEMPQVSVEQLKKLHQAHVMTIPFENLTVYKKEPVSLKQDDLYNKIVRQNRGGYCFELNSLFAALLKEIGFDVTSHLARVYRDGYAESGKTHRVNTVELDGNRYLCDVGFGGNGLVTPLLIEENHEEDQNGLKYRLTALDDQTCQLETRIEDDFIPSYAFSLEPCIDADFEIANFFTSAHPESFFRQVLIATRPIPDGRISLMDREVTIRNGEEKQVQGFDSPEAAWAYFESFGQA
ncbi:arylamine N-acetyltransferase [Eubacteriaceae bacterium ES3]|nr:arylamine N-acetyltransferase [Eubacteriaceae bacterium ES3]